MGRKPRIEDWVYPAFLARRFCLSKSTIIKHIREGNIEAYPMRLNKKGQPSGYRIKRTEVERLDRMGIGPRLHNFSNGRNAI